MHVGRCSWRVRLQPCASTACDSCAMMSAPLALMASLLVRHICRVANPSDSVAPLLLRHCARRRRKLQSAIVAVLAPPQSWPAQWGSLASQRRRAARNMSLHGIRATWCACAPQRSIPALEARGALSRVLQRAETSPSVSSCHACGKAVRWPRTAIKGLQVRGEECGHGPPAGPSGCLRSPTPR